MASKAATALLSRIVEIANEHTDERTYIATSRLSTPVQGEHIDVLSRPDGAFVSAEAVAAAVELSKMVNCVQDGSNTYKHPASVGASFVTNVYKNAVDDIEFARAPLTADQKADLDRAEAILYVDAPFVRTDLYVQFAELRVEVASQEIDRSETLRNLEQADEAEKDLIEDRLQAIEAELKANRALLAALDAQHGFTKAEAIYNGATVAGFPPKLERAHELLDDPAFEITNPQRGQESHWPASFFPNQLNEENWIPIRLTRADITAAGTSNTNQLPDVPPPAQQLAVNDEALDLVELEVQLLRVDRPWMWSSIFENRHWRFRPGVEPLSNGKPDAVGQLPAFVTGLIFARNLRLSGRKNMVSTTGTVNLGVLMFRPLATTDAFKLINAQTTPFEAAAFDTKPKTAAPRTVESDLASGSKRTFNLNLATHTVVAVRRIVVTGKAVEGNNKPVDGADMTLTHARTGTVLKGKSDKNGTVVFRLAAEGTYTIAASKKGFRPFNTRRNLKNGQTFTVKLESQLVSNLSAAALVKPLIATPVFLNNDVTVKLHKRADDGSLLPLDVTVEVVAISKKTGERKRQTVPVGKNAVFNNLAREKYDISVFCAVYDVEGPTTRQVDASTLQTMEFNFRPRTILQSNDTFLFGFLCYRTPLSPNPDPTADFGDG